MAEIGEWTQKGLGLKEDLSHVLLKILGKNLKGIGADKREGEHREVKKDFGSSNSLKMMRYHIDPT